MSKETMKKNLKIISVYNRYLNRGGEDEVFEGEAKLLKTHGCEVVLITDQVYTPEGQLERLKMAANALWSKEWHRKFSAILEAETPDIVHVHNFFPNLSPSIYYACRKKNVPVVQTLHNYRLLCPKATFYRNDTICEKCLGKHLKWPSVVHACYKESRSQSMVITTMLSFHNMLNTWGKAVDLYIALTEFSRQKFIEGGLPAEKITVKPNFVPFDPGPGNLKEDFGLYIGRLSAEKGIRTFIKGLTSLPHLPFKIVGDGPLLDEIKDFTNVAGLGKVELLGRQPREVVTDLMQRARFLVFPSEWYETFGLVAIEAFACGTPVIASRLGAMAEIVQEGRTGLLFTPGNAQDLAEKVRWAWEHPEEIKEMGQNARSEYEQKYTAEENYRMLMGIYEKARAGKVRIG